MPVDREHQLVWSVPDHQRDVVEPEDLRGDVLTVAVRGAGIGVDDRNEGHAGLVTSTHQCWFRLVTTGDSLEVVVSQAEGHWGRTLSRDWHVDDEEIPGLLHQLNLCQSVLYRTAVGLTIRLWVEPEERAVRCEEQMGEHA